MERGAPLRIREGEPHVPFRELVSKAEIGVRGDRSAPVVRHENAKVRVGLDPDVLRGDFGDGFQDGAVHVPAKLFRQACRGQRLRRSARLRGVEGMVEVAEALDGLPEPPDRSNVQAMTGVRSARRLSMSHAGRKPVSTSGGPRTACSSAGNVVTATDHRRREAFRPADFVSLFSVQRFRSSAN